MKTTKQTSLFANRRASRLLAAFAAIGYLSLMTSGATYAADDLLTKSETTSFKVPVAQVLTLSGVTFVATDSTSTTTIDLTPGSLGTGTISATVDSNVKYSINLQASTPNLTAAGTTPNIPAITGTSALTSGTGWGVMKKTDESASTYTGLTPTAQTFFTSTSLVNTAVTTNFNVGVRIDSTAGIPSGLYSTTVTVTAISA